MKSFFYSAAILLMFFVACENNEKFISSPAGFSYRIINRSNPSNGLKINDYVVLNLAIYKDDSLLFDSQKREQAFRHHIKDTANYDSQFDKALLLMQTGDSLLLKLNAGNFYRISHETALPAGIKPEDDLIIHITINEILSPDELAEIRENLLRRENAKQELLIRDYLEREALLLNKDSSGLYLQVLEEGKGATVEPGDSLLVHYKGRLLNGLVFYNSFERNEPFAFVLGNNSLIEAWEKALSGKREGDKIIFITPFQMAYGGEGFGNQIPPWSPLIFEIKILKKIKK